MDVRRLVLLALLTALGCAPSGPRTDAIDPSALPSHGRFTALIFYAKHCNCLDAHEGRIGEMYGRFHERGVTFLFVDSEVGADQAEDDAATRGRFPFPVWIDHGAKLANELGAEYATYSVIVDEGGRVRYRGGIDSDKTHLHDDATPYLADALDDLLAGRPVRSSSNEGLGCALRKW